MGTRGLIVWRYRRRYYVVYNHWDSYPEGLGKALAERLPSDKSHRATYIDAEIKKMKEWDIQWMQYICRSRADYLNETEKESAEATEPVRSDSLANTCIQGTSKLDEYDFGAFQRSVRKELYSEPSYAPLLNDLFIEWVYTFDYDNRVFSVNNQLHLSLDRMDNLKWISAFDYKSCNLNLLEPSAVTDIAVAAPSRDEKLLDRFDMLELRLVHPQGIRGFSRSHRHGPIFRTCIFERFVTQISPVLNVGLWSWQADDLPFREIAYVFLSLASSSHMALVKYQNVKVENRHGFSDLVSSHLCNDSPQEKPEFLTHLWTGSHVQGFTPGSAPDRITYWFQGALVHLATHLEQLDQLRAKIAFVQQRCLVDRPGRSSNALLMSVEHVVFLRIYADGKRVDHSDLRPLFHSSLQYTSPQFYRTQAGMILRSDDKDKIDNDEPRGTPAGTANVGTDQGGNAQQDALVNRSTSPDDTLADILVTFTELTQFLEVSAYENVRKWSKESTLPVEIIELILRNVTDVETSRACMQVSPVFRDIGLKYWVISDGMIMSAVHWGGESKIQKMPEVDVAVPVQPHKTIWSRCDELNDGGAVLGLVAGELSLNERLIYDNARSYERGNNDISTKIFEHESSILVFPDSGLGCVDKGDVLGTKLKEPYSVVIGDQKHRRTLLKEANLPFVSLTAFQSRKGSQARPEPRALH